MTTSTAPVDTHRYLESGLRLNPSTVLGFAAHHRHFGPGQLLVLAADGSGRIMSLSHGPLDDRPESVLVRCLAAIDDEQASLVAAIADSISGRLTGCPQCRFEEAYEAAEQFGARLYDWLDCDGSTAASLRLICGGFYGDLPRSVRPGRLDLDTITPAAVEMPVCAGGPATTRPTVSGPGPE